MKKLLAGIFIFSVMLFSVNSAMAACSKKCDCGCKKGQQCTCFKDKKGNCFKTDIINLQANELKAEIAEKAENSGDEQCIKKCSKKFFKKAECNCKEKCTKDCKCKCHKTKACDKEIKACPLEQKETCDKSEKKINKLLFWKKTKKACEE